MLVFICPALCHTDRNGRQNYTELDYAAEEGEVAWVIQLSMHHATVYIKDT